MKLTSGVPSFGGAFKEGLGGKLALLLANPLTLLALLHRQTLNLALVQERLLLKLLGHRNNCSWHGSVEDASPAHRSNVAVPTKALDAAQVVRIELSFAVLKPLHQLLGLG